MRTKQMFELAWRRWDIFDPLLTCNKGAEGDQESGRRFAQNPRFRAGAALGDDARSETKARAF
jgi:hypothetical protein